MARAYYRQGLTTDRGFLHTEVAECHFKSIQGMILPFAAERRQVDAEKAKQAIHAIFLKRGLSIGGPTHLVVNGEERQIRPTEGRDRDRGDFGDEVFQ